MEEDIEDAFGTELETEEDAAAAGAEGVGPDEEELDPPEVGPPEEEEEDEGLLGMMTKVKVPEKIRMKSNIDSKCVHLCSSGTVYHK